MALYLAQVFSTMDVESSFSKWGKGHIAREVARLIEGSGLGSHTGSLDIQRDPSTAVGILTLSSSSGTVGGVIGGKTVTVAFATSDANTADLIAAAILADTTANKFVGAVSRTATATVTISSGSGTITATINGRATSVTWATSDTATAAALALAINQDSLNACLASSSAGVVTVYAKPSGAFTGQAHGTGSTNTAGNSITLAASGTGATASAAVLSNGGTNANVLVYALTPGQLGLGVTLVASGTGVTASSGANLVGGNGALGNSFTV